MIAVSPDFVRVNVSGLECGINPFWFARAMAAYQNGRAALADTILRMYCFVLPSEAPKQISNDKPAHKGDKPKKGGRA